MEHLFFQKPCRPQADPACVIRGDCYRFTLISRRILRLEYDSRGIFEDRKTQTIWNRQIERTAFTLRETDDKIEILTQLYTLHYQKGPFTPYTLTVDAHNDYTNYGATWRFGQSTYGDPPRHHNLYGTTRTLDKRDGPCELDFGLMDRSGHSIIDDSQSMIVAADGTLEPRREGIWDLYYIACEHDYADTLREYYLLTGAPPMLPRFAFGNWWSRYHAYSAEEYLALMAQFEDKKMPFSVAVIDMDWHVKDVPPSCGRGWTGYTWNKALFPDPPLFIKSLHERNMRVSLNLHPADGIQPCEDVYEAVARRMDVDLATRHPVAFDCSNPQFMQVYREEVLHPLEKQGVDFWWIDWQQGKWNATPGMDPLWQLNHSLYLDNCRNEKRSLILSRYAGLGSHRYPLGFSGDTHATWESLQFQPYFTATAANVGFTWWSHDIGGFKAGLHDRELYIRWLQFGVFSPILRLHSTNNPFSRKEPWAYDSETERIAIGLMQLRTRLIPYIYTMSWHCSAHLMANLYPVYWRYPENQEAYQVKNQYFFGSELMICAITAKSDIQTRMASVRAWIPEGIWTDFESGKVYQGPKNEMLSRPIDMMAVLAKPGAIVPMNHTSDDACGLPVQMDLLIFPGASGRFSLFEDDGESFSYAEGKCAITEITWAWKGEQAELIIHPTGDLRILPKTRSWNVSLRGISAATASCSQNAALVFDADTRTLLVRVDETPTARDIRICFSDIRLAFSDHVAERVFGFLSDAEMSIDQKNGIWKQYQSCQSTAHLITTLAAMNLQKPLMDILTELIMD